MKLTCKYKNSVVIVEASERLVLVCIGLFFGLRNVFPYVWMKSFPDLIFIRHILFFISVSLVVALYNVHIFWNHCHYIILASHVLLDCILSEKLYNVFRVLLVALLPAYHLQFFQLAWLVFDNSYMVYYHLHFFIFRYLCFCIRETYLKVCSYSFSKWHAKYEVIYTWHAYYYLHNNNRSIIQNDIQKYNNCDQCNTRQGIRLPASPHKRKIRKTEIQKYKQTTRL